MCHIATGGFTTWENVIVFATDHASVVIRTQDSFLSYVLVTQALVFSVGGVKEYTMFLISSSALQHNSPFLLSVHPTCLTMCSKNLSNHIMRRQYITQQIEVTLHTYSYTDIQHILDTLGLAH